VTLTVLAALAGCILAFWLGRALAGREDNYSKIFFRASAARWSDALQRTIADRVGRVSTTAAFVRSSDINDRKDFHIFVSEITKDITSFEVLAWAPRIPAALRDAHEGAVRKQGFPKYTISRRDDAGQLHARSERKEYYPILFAEPSSADTDSLLGLDLASDPGCQAAMRQAETTGLATVAIYTALSGNKMGNNLLFVVDRARYESVATILTKRPADQPENDGFVLGVLSMEPLAKRWLGLPDLGVSPGVDVYISADGKNLTALRTGRKPQELLSDAGAVASPPAKPPPGGTMAVEDFDVGNANFKIVYVAPVNYIASCRSRKPAVAVLTGLILTGMAVAYFWLLTGRMAAVERTVADRWLELRERERYIRHLMDNTSDAIFLCDQQGTILDVNRRAYESLGYRREELLLMTVDDVELAAGADDATPLPKLAAGADDATPLPKLAAGPDDPRPLPKPTANDRPQDFEAVHLRKDGTRFPVEVHVTSVGIGQQQLRLAIVRDITYRKRAEGTLST